MRAPRRIHFWPPLCAAGPYPRARARAALERSDFAVRRLPLIFALKKPQGLDPCLPRSTQKKHHILLKRPHGTLAENQKMAVSAPLYRALSHTSRRRSPDFAVRWRPEWPVSYRRRRRSAGRRPPAAARRTPPVSRSLSRSRCVGPSVVVVSVAVSVAVSVSRSFARTGWWVR